MKKISVVVPCYNEEESIPIFYEEILKVSKKMETVAFEFLFIDDGSVDDTLKEIKKLKEADNRVRYISFSRNFGKEAGLYAGLEHSTGDYVVVMDADMQDPPSMLIDMYQYVEEGYDCVALYSKDHDDYPFMRRVFTKIWYKVIGVLSSVEQVPGARDYRLMNRKMVNAILSMKEYNRYSKGAFAFVGFETKWIDYKTPERVSGTTKWSFFNLFQYAIEGITAFSTVPLVISAIIGIIFCLIAFIAIIVIIGKTVLFGDPVSGWPSLACMIIFVSGVQLFFLGIIGLYLSKTYLEVKNRPKYIIKETENSDSQVS